MPASRSWSRGQLSIPCLGLVAGLLAGGCCSAGWSGANRDALREDTDALLASQAMDPSAENCRMIGTTREGACDLTMPSADAMVVAQGLGLAAIEPGSALAGEFDAQVSRHDDACFPAVTAVQPGSVELYGAFQRPATAPGFEFVVLFVEPSSGDCCLQLSYAYG